MYKITLAQKDILTNSNFENTCKFHPVEDIHGDWFISKKEVETNHFAWFANLVETPFVANPEPTID